MKKLLLIFTIAFLGSCTKKQTPLLKQTTTSNISGIITTIVGNSPIGYNGQADYNGDGEVATLANLATPSCVAVDNFGNIYIADTYNNRIRKVTSTGIISTFAGNGSYGFSGDGGAAIEAQLFIPSGVAVDGVGNVYIEDQRHIRKVNKSGIISTIAGVDTVGYSGDGGLAIEATLNQVQGLAVDGAGNVYIADTYNQRIRKVNTAGIISTIAGNGICCGYNGGGNGGDGGAATSAELYMPSGVAVDGSGNIYIADTWDSRIRKINTAGIINTIAGNGIGDTAIGTSIYGGYSGDGGMAIAAQLNWPYGVMVDNSGNIYIADTRNMRIRKVTTSGIISTIAGSDSSYGFSGDNGAATMAKLDHPTSIAMDSTGNLYIADEGNNRIRKVNK